MTAVHHFLPSVTEDPAASYMVADKAPTSVGHLIMAAKGMHPAMRSVLADICQLYECGGRGCFDANNGHLAKRLGMTEPMVSRHISALVERGYLLLTPRVAGQRRTLTPTPELRSSYRSGKVADLTEVVRLGAKSGKVVPESGKDSLTEVVRIPYRSGKHKLIEVKKEETLLSKIAELEQKALAADAASQKKIAELEAENLRLKKRIEKSVEVFKAQEQQLESLRAQTSLLPAAPPAPKRRAARTEADPLAGKGALMLEVYRTWYRQHNQAEPPAGGAADNKAARAIYQTLFAQPGAGTDETTVALFTALLQNWNRLEAFLQRQQKLIQIASNLTNILPQLIHHGTSQQLTPSPANRATALGLIPADQVANAFAACRALGLD
jgi:DNA-binding MarR family transcriptional regulator